MAHVNLSLQILPLVPEEELYGVVDKVIAHIQKSGVVYHVGPMETTMEGELPDLLRLVAEAQDICIAAGAPRVISNIKIDYKPGGVKVDEKIAKYR
ncbi:MAG: thiamine-binding protein [Dethiobacteria bacterium]|jgi:uncharacterized protein YqgV (UPF0045/DUF77 family)|nr:thiamine-binding protein [Bacillota bacterium]